MKLFFRKNPGISKTRIIIFSLLFTFGIMTGLAPFLHAHDFDLDHIHKDCIPCHWAQSHSCVENQAAEISLTFSIQSLDFSPFDFFLHSSLLAFNNRGPPSTV